jgi:8-oxo-dGTP pyrophosphatase MutT (NUDIX family)
MASSPAGPYRKRRTAGTVLTYQGHILLCRPTNGFGGYVWTFSKGGIDPHEPADQAAIRETLEETGYLSRIIAPIPGLYESSKSVGVYYLAEPIAPQRPFDRFETAEVKWVSPEQALVLLQLSPNVSGRLRDVEVFRQACLLKERLRR